jgi:glycoside hydrolase-like protein
MSFRFVARVAPLLLMALVVSGALSLPRKSMPKFYLGFDRNEYPGDDAFPILRKTFVFTSYWLSAPPGEKINTWKGKREFLRSNGFGFLVLFRAPESAALERLKDPELAGKTDARSSADAAEREGFPQGTIIFLDIEDGGRLSPQFHSYIHGWSSDLRVAHNHAYRVGFYCSSIPVKEDVHTSITTVEDISSHLLKEAVPFVMWAYNDACPPSPGCAFPHDPPAPSGSGISEAAVWQFVQSPRRRKLTAHCPAKYAPDGNCYAPGDTAHKWFLDVNSATSPDPSGGAK